MKEHILIIEDEIAIQNILKELLLDAGYVVDVASDGAEGIEIVQSGDFQLILLDIMLPKMDGYAVCEHIRQTSNVPIIMLTALDEETYQVKGFEVLADDYITKPFSLKVVLKRVEAILRRSLEHTNEDHLLTHQNIRLDIVGMRAYVDEQEVILTKLEFDLLSLFMRHKHRVYTREELLDIVWGMDYEGYEKAVNIHIMNLRKKLHTTSIETVRGVGYRLV